MRTVRHQLVIGGMELDLVTTVAAGIEYPQFRRVFVREASPRRHRCRSPMPAEIGQFAPRQSAAVGSNRVGERRVQRKQIDILERRRLIEYLVDVGGGMGHAHSSLRTLSN